MDPQTYNFTKNPYSKSRFVPLGRTDMTKLIVAFRNFVKMPKNQVPTSQKTNSASHLDTKQLTLREFIAVLFYESHKT